MPVVFLLAGFAVERVASADAKTEEAAKALRKRAMEEDYLATDFNKAIDKLQQAIAKCGAEKCSATTRAILKRDLGTVYVAGLNDKDRGTAAFAEALAIDPSLQLDPDLKTKEVEAAWNSAKGTGGGETTPPVSTTRPTGPVHTGIAGQPQGDFVHVPAVEQQIRTPVPIYAEYSGAEPIVKAIVKYKGFGMPDFKSFELHKMGTKGWGGVTPCLDVQQGDFLYYLQGFNEQNDPVATGGDRSHPFKVPIKTKIEAASPHLPGEPPPSQCKEVGDCPPDFPGCHKGEAGNEPAEGKGEG
jgi:hypothetical protein